MSVEALAFVKTLDLGENESAQARLLLYVIGENTFNDSFICGLSQEQLAFEAGRVSDRTIRRHLDELCRARIVLRKERYRSSTSSGRLHDALRIVGFKRWYLLNYGAAKSAHAKGTKPDSRCPPQTGQHVSGTYKDSRTNPVLSEEPREGARQDSISDLEVKAVLGRLRQYLGDDVFYAWFRNATVRRDGLQVVFEASEPFVRNWIREHYGDLVRRQCEIQWPGASVDFTVRPRATNDNVQLPAGKVG